MEHPEELVLRCEVLIRVKEHRPGTGGPHGAGHLLVQLGGRDALPPERRHERRLHKQGHGGGDRRLPTERSADEDAASARLEVV